VKQELSDKIKRFKVKILSGGSWMSENVEVFVEICREGAVIPKYAKPWDAGMDICAAEDVIIRPEKR